MSIILPSKLEHFRHDDIVHLIKELNSQYDLPHRGSWGKGIPDLEEPITRQVVEVAIARELKTVWGQCVYYYRMGASHIHLVLSPRLFRNYKTDECTFVKENPVPNVEVYMLPDNRLPIIVFHKATVKQAKGVKPNLSKHVAIWPFLASRSETENPKIKDVKNDIVAQTTDYSITDDTDDEVMIEPSLLSDANQEVHLEQKPICIDCKTCVCQDEAVFCKQHGWIISKALASEQRLCAF